MVAKPLAPVIVFVFVCQCVHTVNGRHTLHGSRSACIDPEVKTSEVKITWLSDACR